MLAACETTRERRVVFLGILAGVRNQELRRLRGKHFDRPGLIRIGPEVGKGGRSRWLPVLPEAVSVVDEIRLSVAPNEFVVPAQRRDPNREVWFDLPDEGCSGQAVWRLVKRVADRAGVEGNPHALRRAFADLIERHAGVRVAQKLLGHASLATTEGYLSEPTLDELQGAVMGLAVAPSVARSSARSKQSVRPLSSVSRTVSPSTSTSTGSVSLVPTVAKQSANMEVPPGGFEPPYSSRSLVVRVSRLMERCWYSQSFREAVRSMGDA